MTKAQESKVWKSHSGMFALPTALLAIVTFIAHVLVAMAHATGFIGDGAAAIIAALCAYIAFTPLHEASHGNITGRSGHKRVETFIGWLSGLQLMAPMPAFKVLHLRHHGQTNHAEDDPDMWVCAQGKSPFVRAISLVLRCFTLLPHYYLHFFFGSASRSRGGREQRRTVLLSAALLAAGAATLCALGLGATVLFAWVVPAFLSTALLGLLFDWLPHRPHTSRERYKDTRAIDAPLGVPMLGQHLHLVHHLYPRVPFYHYRAVFDALRPVLEEKGADIVVMSGPKEAAKATP